MAIEREVWLAQIVENLFPDNSFVNRCVNLDSFANGSKVHVPNAGSPPGVKKDRTVFPATIGVRTDTDLVFALSSYTTDPVKIRNVEMIQLAYNKRESVVFGIKMGLQNATHEGILSDWLTGKGSDVKTSGSAVAAHMPLATGNRKSFTRKDVLAAATVFNGQDIPSEGRYMILDAVLYAQLLEDMTEADKAAFNASANAQKGTIGNLFGFEFYQRSRVGVATSAGVQKDWSVAGAAGDVALALAWHASSVCRAKGDQKLFSLEGDPTLYGDVFSAEVLSGGSKYRNDGKGIVRIVQEVAP